MPLSRDISAYPHETAILDQAVKANGALLTLDSYSSAIAWRQRAHMARKIMRNITGGRTAWDGFKIRVDKDSPVVKIIPIGFESSLTDLEGNPLEAETPKDEWEKAADELSKKLFGDDYIPE